MISPRQSAQAGFTLIEAIMVIVITGVIAAVVAVFIRKPVEGYFDTVRRGELTDAADVALRRIERETRLALPNSLRLKDAANAITPSCDGVECYIEFIPTKWGGRYRDVGDGSASGNFLDISGSGTSFDILGTSPAQPPDIVNGDFLVIYNLGADYSPADAYGGGNRTTVNVVSGTPYVATMASNFFATQSPRLSSPSARFHIVDQTQKVVRFGCNGGNLRRYGACDFAATTTCGSNAVLAQNATCTFEFQANATGRNGALVIKLKLTDPTSGEFVELHDQIHIDNAP